MWSFVLTVSLLCWGSEGTVTCRDNNNGAVDWYILYKAPALQPLTGLEYLYIDSAGTVTPMKPSTPSYKSIKHPNGVLANTLQPLFTPIRSMLPSFGFVSYSDQPPGCSASSEFGHSKGKEREHVLHHLEETVENKSCQRVLMVNRTGTGVWLLHSTPQFPFRRDQNQFWPDSGGKYAQTFICVTFPYNQFRHIGKHLQYIGAFPFEHDIPGDFHQELRDAVNWVQIPPPNNWQQLTPSGGAAFYSIAKQQSAQPKGGDLYVTIAEAVSSDLNVQTWGCQHGRKLSYCVTGIHKVFNVKTIKTDLGDWGPKNDHSKWCVAKDQNKLWTCIADVNRALTQYKRRGGALCLSNDKIHTIFQRIAGGTEECPTVNIMDVTDTDCEADPDADMTSLMG